MKVLARKAGGKYHIFKNTTGWTAKALCGREYYYVGFTEKINIKHPDFCKACRHRFNRALNVVRCAVKVEEPE